MIENRQKMKRLGLYIYPIYQIKCPYIIK